MESLRTVMFDDAGEGVYLRLRNRDLRTLLNQFGVKYVEVVTEGIMRYDLDIIQKVLDVATKKGDVEHKVSLDDLDEVPLERLQGNLLDALSLSVNGRKYLDQLAYVDAEIKRRQRAGEPEAGPTSP